MAYSRAVSEQDQAKIADAPLATPTEASGAGGEQMIERWKELDFNYKMGDSGACVEMRDLLWRHREALRRVVEAAKKVAEDFPTIGADIVDALAELER